MGNPLDLIDSAPVPKLAASDMIAQTLRGAIVEGLLPAGELLRQDELAARFHVSKIPVREALKRLEAEGLVSFERNRGALVASLSIEEIQEYVDIRALLEEHAAALAAPAVDAERIARAEAVLNEYCHETNIARWGELNWEFHSALYGAARRPILMAQIRAIHDKVERYVRTLLSLTSEMPKTQREHAAILCAFKRRDPERAARLTRAHVLDGGATLVKHLISQRNKGGK